MDLTFVLRNRILPFALVVSLFIAIIFLLQSSFYTAEPLLSVGITIDLLLTIPLLYFLAIRKTDIPKITVLPVLILGIILGSILIPKEDQMYLSLFKTWVLPVIELTVLGLIIYHIRKAILDFKAENKVNRDFYTALLNTSRKILPRKVAPIFCAEISVLYYGLYSWKKKKLQSHEFSYHKESGTLALLYIVIFLVIAETAILHILLIRWSPIAAWIATGISLYTGLQILGWIKSIPRRPIGIDNEHLHLKYGILNEAEIPISSIDRVEHFTKSFEKSSGIKHLSLLGELESHNILLTLKQPQKLDGIYGLRKEFDKLVFHVDQPDEFISAVTDRVN